MISRSAVTVSGLILVL